jgi:pyruvate/2-oxoglutarate dehydrogenase complex dihydrolipoamide dehydrogenase (E3) component
VREYVKTGKLPETSEKENHYYEIKAKNFLIATGTRPSYLEIEGSQHAISSDDVFSLKKPPGKTLVVGGGYVAVEIAGFLKGLGFDVTLMTRGDYLRSFDKDMVNHIMEDLKQRKVDIRATSLPKKILKNQETNKL